MFDTTQHFGALNLSNNAAATIIGIIKALRMTSLTLGASATLDLNANDLIHDYTGASPATMIRSLIASARIADEWTGPGLTNTAAKTDAT